MCGRPRARWAALAPFAASVGAAVLALSLGGREIAAPVSFHGRTARQAADPWRGVQHTLQAIPENLVLGNLALVTETTAVQGAILTGGLALAWLATRRRGALEPLEVEGAAQVVSAYLLEWTFRGYLPFSSLRGMLPHYDVVPHFGAVLFVGGWYAGLRGGASLTRHPLPSSRLGALGVIVLLGVLVGLHRPRAEALWRRERVTAMTSSERRHFPVPELQWLRNNAVALARAKWQRQHLARLDRAEATARRLHLDRAAIHRVFGRIVVPELPPDADALDLLDLPAQDTETRPERIVRALAQDFIVDPEPRPEWLEPSDVWPPPVTPPASP
jgi:hypothetical protein